MRMFSRRNLLLGGLAMAASTPALKAEAHHSNKQSRRTFKLNPIYSPQRVRYRNTMRPGTIVVDPRKHFLYLIENRNTARRYGVGVGKAGLAFKGSATISRKAKWPRWTPTANMIRREPQKYARYAKGVPGGVNNPLGARALYLYRGGRDTYYRIHGTTQPSSIGRSVSNGCIRMVNEHVTDLYQRVPVGTRVIVI